MNGLKARLKGKKGKGLKLFTFSPFYLLTRSEGAPS
jgi:hypothetical protein